jgi:hypothetical protein
VILAVQVAIQLQIGAGLTDAILVSWQVLAYHLTTNERHRSGIGVGEIELQGHAHGRGLLMRIVFLAD